MTGVNRWAVLAILGLGCVQPLEPRPAEDLSELEPGETRTVELWMLELNVDGYEQSIDLETLRGLPQSTLDETWLLDMPLLGLVESTLGQLRDLPIDQALDLPIAAQNMRTMLRMTPDNAELTGTSLEELLSLSAVLGIPSANTLADLFEVEITEEVLPLDSAARAVVAGLIATHPETQTRQGPVDAEHPDGIWPVAPNSMPITVGDVVTNFASTAERFAPAETEWGTHPGFIEEANGFSVIEDEFEMIVKVRLNALPYRGLDLTNASSATVNSTGAQIDEMFATDDPEWLRIEGMVDEPWISTLTTVIRESDQLHSGGDSRYPEPTGNSTAWDLAPWEFERLVAEMAYDVTGQLSPKEISYELQTGTVIFTAEMDDTGWVTFETFNNAGNPPPPQYVWDHELELSQIRLHDGGLAEGDGDISFTLTDVPIGLTSDEIGGLIGDNLAADPAALRDLATAINENSVGLADFYYYRPPPDASEADAGDWLYFIDAIDFPIVDEGGREYTYELPGFYADKGLGTKVSSAETVHGDDVHEKVRVETGDVLYIQDDLGVVFEIAVLDKPSLHRIALDITRL